MLGSPEIHRSSKKELSPPPKPKNTNFAGIVELCDKLIRNKQEPIFPIKTSSPNLSQIAVQCKTIDDVFAKSAKSSPKIMNRKSSLPDSNFKQQIGLKKQVNSNSFFSKEDLKIKGLTYKSEQNSIEHKEA